MTKQAGIPVHHLLSLLRPVLGAVILAEMVRSHVSMIALPLTFLACGTDWLDGRVARDSDSVTPRGHLIDNLCDAVFLAFVFTAYAWRGVWSDPLLGSAVQRWEHANWLPLMALVASFGAYSLRSWLEARRGFEPARSPRGHTAGVANYILAILGGIAVFPAVPWSPWVLEPSFLTVVLLNGSAVGENLRLMGAMPGRSSGK